MPLSLTVNGQPREFSELTAPSSLQDLVEHLNLKADRVALEHNGRIAPRNSWGEPTLHTGDRVELVHFVGGGSQITPGWPR